MFTTNFTLSEKITHQIKNKLFLKRKMVHLGFWSVGEIENVYGAKNRTVFKDRRKS